MVSGIGIDPTRETGETTMNDENEILAPSRYIKDWKGMIAQTIIYGAIVVWIFCCVWYGLSQVTDPFMPV